ncbi:hypothetical protein BDQ17DRAFT_1430239 [Cyathus striatus]|nr:hypothetical protein BDQ17DRAFT_1430239 [Cyathus striatus]
MVKVIPKNTPFFEFLSIQLLQNFVRFRNDIAIFFKFLMVLRFLGFGGALRIQLWRFQVL